MKPVGARGNLEEFVRRGRAAQAAVDDALGAAQTVHGYVGVGPRGMLPGTFNLNRQTALTAACGCAIVGRYFGHEVTIRRAALTIPVGATTWHLSARSQARIDACTTRPARRGKARR
jgi:hypothetical protein